MLPNVQLRYTTVSILKCGTTDYDMKARWRVHLRLMVLCDNSHIRCHFSNLFRNGLANQTLVKKSLSSVKVF